MKSKPCRCETQGLGLAPQRVFSISPFLSTHPSIHPSLHQYHTVALTNSRYHLRSISLFTSHAETINHSRTHTQPTSRRLIPTSTRLIPVPHISPVNHRGRLSAMAKSNISNQSNNNKRSLAMSVAGPKANVMASCYAVEAATGDLASFHYCSSSRAGGMCTQANCTARFKTNSLSRSRVVGLREALETLPLREVPPLPHKILPHRLPSIPRL